MSKCNAKNERLKREYLQYLGEAKGRSIATLDGVRKSLRRYEDFRQGKDFLPFHREQAIAFKKFLSAQAGRDGKSLSKATIFTTLGHVKDFYTWLSYQPSAKRKIHLPDMCYFNLSEKEVRIAKSVRHKRIPTLEQIRRVLQSMPFDGDVALRNRALIAFTALTGIRDSALISLKLKHVHLDEGLVVQDPMEVKTKFSKRIDTYFLPIGEDFKEIVIEWVNYLYRVKFFGHDSPLFPRTGMALDGDGCFSPCGIEMEHWRTTAPVRDVFRQAFGAANLPYCNPHSFRNTLVLLGQKLCTTAESFKAWSQNLGHEGVLTTLTSYGTLSMERQGEVLKGLQDNLNKSAGSR